MVRVKNYETVSKFSIFAEKTIDFFPDTV